MHPNKFYRKHNNCTFFNTKHLCYCCLLMVPPRGSIWTPHLSPCSALLTALILLLKARTWLVELMLSDTAFRSVKTLYPCVHQTIQFHAKKEGELKEQSGCSDWTPLQGSKRVESSCSPSGEVWVTRPGFHLLLELQIKIFLNLNLLLF